MTGRLIVLGVITSNVVIMPTRTSAGLFFFFFNDTATTEIYTLSLHDALPISSGVWRRAVSKDRPIRRRRRCWSGAGRVGGGRGFPPRIGRLGRRWWRQCCRLYGRRRDLRA